MGVSEVLLEKSLGSERKAEIQVLAMSGLGSISFPATELDILTRCLNSKE